MSAEKNRSEASRWLQTAREDFETVEVLRKAGRHAHACFHAQQAGEKAIQAVWHLHASDPWGHSLRKLIEDGGKVLPDVFGRWQDLLKDAARLDRYYIPTRYPNGLPDITPDAAFFREDAEAAIELARRLIDRAAATLPS
jgi:HEPN domain-containing protein